MMHSYLGWSKSLLSCQEVLILVLMDDALVQGTPEDVQTRWIAVLILVLMDDALVLVKYLKKLLKNGS